MNLPHSSRENFYAYCLSSCSCILWFVSPFWVISVLKIDLNWKFKRIFSVLSPKPQRMKSLRQKLQMMKVPNKTYLEQRIQVTCKTESFCMNWAFQFSHLKFGFGSLHPGFHFVHENNPFPIRTFRSAHKWNCSQTIWRAFLYRHDNWFNSHSGNVITSGTLTQLFFFLNQPTT